MATAIPAFLAKTAIVFDPLVYGFSHPQFRSSARHILQQFNSHNGGRGGGGLTTITAGRIQTNPSAANCHPSARGHSSLIAQSSLLNRPLTITKNNVTIKDSADDVMPSADSILAANKNGGIYLNKSNDSDELMSRRINRVHMTQHQLSVILSSAKQLTPVMENSQHHSTSHYKDTCF